MKSLKINTKANQTGSALEVVGMFNSSNALNHKADLFEAINEAKGDVWLDLREAAQIDLTAFNILIQAYRKALAQGKVIELTAPKDNSLEEMLNMSKLHHCFVQRAA